MLQVEDYARIRLAHRDGMSIREIARTFGHSRWKIRQVLLDAQPKPYTLRQPRPSRTLSESIQRTIDEILELDRTAPKKQRHTIKRIFDRLSAEHGFTGKYDAVRRYINSRKTPLPETFLPIALEAGQRAEADFGQIEVDFPEGRRTVSVLLITWAYSSAVFAIALPSEKVEAILHGTVEAFRYFGCVPRELWWDNPKTVAQTILRGRHRELNRNYQALASHYNFSPLCCLPARGNEKPHVEGRVKWMKRNWATPVPRVKDLAEFNAHLRQCCQADEQRTVSGQSQTIGQRFATEREQALSVPAVAFDACVQESRAVDKYQSVVWEGNRYSVPRRDAFSTVVVKAYTDRIDVVRNGSVVASHERSYGKGEMIFDPLHYLSVLECKPAYLDHTEVYRNWRLPAEITALREHFEQRHGRLPGARQFIGVLQLLAQHSQARVVQAIRHCQQEGVVTSQRILFRCEQLAQQTGSQLSDSTETNHLPVTHASRVAQVYVPAPDLSRFDALLKREAHSMKEAPVSAGSVTAASGSGQVVVPFSMTQGGVSDVQVPASENHTDEPGGTPTTAIEPQAVAAANDVGRTCEVSSRSSGSEPGLLGVPVATERIGVSFTGLQCFTASTAYGELSGSEGTRFF
jgi:transposase